MKRLNKAMLEKGMSDEQLEYFSKNRRLHNGFSPWAHWESERNSFGMTFRSASYFPRFLPLFFSSDHGVTPGAVFEESEKFTTSGLYLSWNELKVRALREEYNVNALHVPNPWIEWRRRNFPFKSLSASGTLFFWPHRNESVVPYIDIDLVKSALEKLPDSYKPITLMLMSHDVNSGLHRALRDLGLPIITAGSIMSQSFVRNFYYILSHFNQGCGLTWGSHVFYCLEFGVPFRIIAQESVKYKSLGTPELPPGYYDHTSVRFLEAQERLRFESFLSSLTESKEVVSQAELDYALDHLGVFSTITKGEFTSLVWRQLLINFARVPKLWLGLFK